MTDACTATEIERLTRENERLKLALKETEKAADDSRRLAAKHLEDAKFLRAELAKVARIASLAAAE